jgi:hypothetical protein
VSRFLLDHVYARFVVAAIEVITLVAALTMLGATQAQAFEVDAYAAQDYDVEAYAVQAANPNLVVNGGFREDLAGWSFVDPAVSWDAADAAANPSSGSLEVNEPLGTVLDEISAARQCVVLPTPGRYQLTAKGNGGTAAIFQDYLSIRWGLLPNGGNCTDIGAKFGVVSIPVGAGWRQPSSPALIEVSAAVWTPASAIAIELVIEKNQGEEAGGISGRFDEVSLVLQGDTVFKDGFD